MTRPSSRKLSTSQAAGWLNMSSDRVRQLARAGRLPFGETPLGRLFDAHAVEALATARAERAKTDPRVVTTATTVGYGDLYPVTDTGRLIAIGLMAVGIGFVGFFTAAIAQRFIVPQVEADIEAASTHTGHEEAEILRQVQSLREQLATLEASLVRMRSDRSRASGADAGAVDP